MMYLLSLRTSRFLVDSAVSLVRMAPSVTRIVVSAVVPRTLGEANVIEAGTPCNSNKEPAVTL